MQKETTYQEKFVLLDRWLPSIIETVKKDLKNDHLKNDWQFLKAHFPGKTLNKLTTEELTAVYKKTLADGAESVGEFIASRWLLKNSEIYYYFEEQLTRISPNFNELQTIAREPAIAIMEGAIQQFGAYRTYVFSVFNAVVFPQEIFDELARRAEKSEEERQSHLQAKQEQQSIQDLQRSHAQEIARLTDKYEKKLLGLQKKYIQDVNSLKKQITQMHRKYSGQPV